MRGHERCVAFEGPIFPVDASCIAVHVAGTSAASIDIEASSFPPSPSSHLKRRKKTKAARPAGASRAAFAICCGRPLTRQHVTRANGVTSASAHRNRQSPADGGQRTRRQWRGVQRAAGLAGR